MSVTQKGRNLTQSQKMMVFVLSAAAFGLSELITQIVPTISLGPIDLNVAYFAFIPVTLAILFDPPSAALGAVTGSSIFSDLLMGDFGGIGVLEGFIQQSIAFFAAGMMVSDPRNKRQIVTASIACVGIDKLISGIVDTAKVVFGVAEFKAVAGLPQSVFALEGIAFVTDLLIAGVLFGALPAMYLVPRLYGKIEPLLGLKPREGRPEIEWDKVFTPKFIWTGVGLFAVSGVIAFMDEMGMQFGSWTPDFLKTYGDNFLYVGMGIAAVALLAVVLLMKSRFKTYELE